MSDTPEPLGAVRMPRPRGDDHLQPAVAAERVQRRHGAGSVGGDASVRSRPRGGCRGADRRGTRFSSGADVQQRQLRPREEMEAHGGPQARDANSENLLTDCVNWKPVICAAHGYVLGLALGIALECDLIVAEEGTKFQVTEAPRGLSGAKYWALLNFRGGGSLAVQVSLTGRFFTAEEALRVNIIDQVAPKGEYLTAAQEWREPSRKIRRWGCGIRCNCAGGN